MRNCIWRHFFFSIKYWSNLNWAINNTLLKTRHWQCWAVSWWAFRHVQDVSTKFAGSWYTVVYYEPVNLDETPCRYDINVFKVRTPNNLKVTNVLLCNLDYFKYSKNQYKYFMNSFRMMKNWIFDMILQYLIRILTYNFATWSWFGVQNSCLSAHSCATRKYCRTKSWTT